jgi:hypothetical protein
MGWALKLPTERLALNMLNINQKEKAVWEDLQNNGMKTADSSKMHIISSQNGGDNIIRELE